MARALGRKLTQALSPAQTPQQRALEVITPFARALSAASDSDDLVERTGQHLASVFEARCAQLYIHEASSRTLRTCRPDDGMPLSVPDDRAAIGRVFQTHEPKLTQRAMIAPVLRDARVSLGVVHVLENPLRPYNHDDLELLEVLAGQVAVALGHVQTLAAHRRQFDSFVCSIACAVDGRDICTEFHSLNVANYALGIGYYLNLNRDDMNLLRLAGFMHDLGKLHTPDRILAKADSLNALEAEELKRHAEHTRYILRRVAFVPELARAARIAWSHHERIDGSGYPDGLRNGDLDLLTRVLCVANAFHGLTQERHFGPGMPVDKALVILDSMTPTALDQRCVGALRTFMGQPPEPPTLVAAA